MPGTAKTLLAKTIARLLKVSYARIQFTPDLMPADIVGTAVYDLKSRAFEVRKGPVFTNILLADEINRAPAKVQSALLEAMEERGVSLEGEQVPLPDPFLVLATQNPVEYEGTYPLPEAQQDRFLFKVVMDYPGPEDEVEVLRRWNSGVVLRDPAAAGVEPVLDVKALAAARAEVQAVIVDEDAALHHRAGGGHPQRRRAGPGREHPRRGPAAAGGQGGGRLRWPRLRHARRHQGPAEPHLPAPPDRAAGGRGRRPDRRHRAGVDHRAGDAPR